MTTLDVLLDGIYDYAGMYPPAALPFEAALQESAVLRGALRRPSLIAADMVLRLELLESLTDAAMTQAGWKPGATCRIALVGVPLEQAEEALDAVRVFHRAHATSGIRRRVVAMEVVMESDLGRDAATVEGALARAARSAGEAVRLYLEPRWDAAVWIEAAPRLFGLLSGRSGRKVGLKVRCAGPTALSHGQMSEVIAWATAAGVPLKATQGLHHPILEERWANPWGFLGLAVALRLRGVLGEAFRADDVLACMGEQDAAAFRFTDAEMSWRGHTVGAAALRAAMTHVPFSIGSCDLREPDADLTRLFG